MIDAGELKRGITIELEGHLYRVVEYQHIKIGRGSAQIRLKLRDLHAGHVIERTFQASQRFTRAHLERRPVQYLYREDKLLYFMGTEDFEQVPLSAEELGDAINYLTEGMSLDMLFHKDKPLGVELPTAVQLKVTETGPGFKGDTASAGGKPATLETGITTTVPFFISTGDVIKVDTRTGEYLERVS